MPHSVHMGTEWELGMVVSGKMGMGIRCYHGNGWEWEWE